MIDIHVRTVLFSPILVEGEDGLPVVVHDVAFLSSFSGSLAAAAGGGVAPHVGEVAVREGRGWAADPLSSHQIVLCSHNSYEMIRLTSSIGLKTKIM